MPVVQGEEFVKSGNELGERIDRGSFRLVSFSKKTRAARERGVRLRSKHIFGTTVHLVRFELIYRGRRYSSCDFFLLGIPQNRGS